MAKSRLYNCTIRCYYGDTTYNQHRQMLKLSDIEKWIEAYRFTHPHVKSFSVQIVIKEDQKDGENKPPGNTRIQGIHI